MIQKLYDRCLDLARHKFSKPILAFISFIESSIFPIPPDVMVVPMVLAKKEDYLKIFLLTTLFSVLGGVFGYFLGNMFLEFSFNEKQTCSMFEIATFLLSTIPIHRLSNFKGSSGMRGAFK